MEAVTKNVFFRDIYLKGGGVGIPKLYVKFWWPLILALKTRPFWPKFTFLFLNVPRGGGGTNLRNIQKKDFSLLPYSLKVR